MHVCMMREAYANMGNFYGLKGQEANSERK